MKYILALDQGTTSSRAIVFDHDGGIVAVAQKEFEQIFPRPGWVEHDPDEIWSSQIGVASEAISRAGLTPRELAAIGIANQRETTVVWERASGRPIHNAIVWQDRRTAGFCDQLREEGHESTFREKTGLVLDSYFSGTKVNWILENVDGARVRAEAGELCFGTIDSWLVWKLTDGGLHITDATNASRTLMYDIHSGDWDDELLGLLDVPRSMLPEVRSSSEVYGETSVELFSHPIPISGIAGDQQAALFGQQCTEPGMVKNTYGTGCFMLLNTGTEAVPSKNNLLTTVAWRIDGKTEYALEGSVFVAGAVVQWLRDGLHLIRNAPEVEALSHTVDDNGGVYMVPAFAGLGAPHWDPYARGMIVGITRGTTAGHFARAALESIAYQVADVLEAMEADSGIEIKELRVDGGAAQNDFLLQFQSDVLQALTVRPEILETTALGAAYLAGLAVGFWTDQAEVAQQWKANRRFAPEMASEAVDVLRSDWRRALERSKGWES
ncbi:MAG: glycerol kinase GlpK [Gemmatimonadales bacterium]|jgi:glycerol kinase|nr:glycerol kinase GlpK [Gemmatimonadales bacterium]MDG2239124.1 glycerol kinase GlpK [Longimicrobiales bacterium]MBT3500587.1 glycerol kinase GlpK [Gemmatimonadales bacterium]MBT3775786.1 glycerol kinase GlpK [Gemmatimonadales bacterium]MBT4188887.1 glycerol kinase GlpK [Gemmatimonadales bacterium]